jgi:hypothetical protein
MTPEGAVVKACLEYLRLRGIFAWRNNTGSLRDKNNRPVFFGKPGSADIIGVMPGGRFICIECKAGRGKLSEKQKEFLHNIEQTGGLAVVARSIEDIEKALRR